MRGGDGARWEVPGEARGPVWVRCPHKEMTLLVDEALKVTGGARLHHGGKEPPPGMTPSTIVLCPSGGESIASAIGHVKAQAPGVPVLLFLGSREDLQPAKSALEGGAHGLLHGGMRPDQVANALASASRGEVVIPEELLWGLATAEEGGGREGPRPAGLPVRQREIVGLVSKGLSDAQVAKRLSLPEHSVKRELHAAYRTLRFKRRIKEAIASRQSNQNDSRRRRLRRIEVKRTPRGR